jgi:hypothetical protein
MEQVYSDSLLALLARARLPEFREKQRIEHSGPGGGPIHFQRDPKLLTYQDIMHALSIIAARLWFNGGKLCRRIIGIALLRSVLVFF